MAPRSAVSAERLKDVELGWLAHANPDRVTGTQKGVVHHTLYDTTSILPLITKHCALPTLAGLKARETALAANGGPQPNDLTDALDLRRNDAL